MHYTPISNGIIPVRNGTNNDINKLDYGPVLYLYIHPVDLGLWPALVSLFSFLFFVVSFFFFLVRPCNWRVYSALNLEYDQFSGHTDFSHVNSVYCILQSTHPGRYKSTSINQTSYGADIRSSLRPSPSR